MENGMDTNAANSIDSTADMTNQTVIINKVTYDGDEPAESMATRSLNQAADSHVAVRAHAQSVVGAARAMAHPALSSGSM